MELREFAEQVLFSTSLEEKLLCPDALTDLAPGPAIRTPHQPGRPRELIFRTGTAREGLPSLQHLEKEAARGRLLHFFANHELLATELMALVLLKFPDAPKPFRRGILQTLRDEQEHTRMYMERMRGLGLAFGSHPVNGCFWHLIAFMESPMDYVSRLSLTFEQANLDYSGYFAEQFRRIGDKASEALLARIHHEEVAHVGYGLKWFRRWKDPHQTDWQAFESALPYPLSPNRAKGVMFNAEARRRAGLDTQFIDELYVYAKSKGRTPGVFLFNPLAETRMGRGSGYQPRAHLEGFVRDLSNLPQYLCRTDDVVLVHRRPATGFLAGLKEAGFELPQFEVLEKGNLARDSELRARKIGSLRPWAWSPDSIGVLEPLLPNLTRPAMPIGADWNGRIQPLFSKAWAADRLREFLADSSGPLPPQSSAWLISPAHIGRVARSVEEALHLVEDFRTAGLLASWPRPSTARLAWDCCA